MTKCKLCNNEYSVKCAFQQGRCPGHPPMFKVESFKNSIVAWVNRVFKKCNNDLL